MNLKFLPIGTVCLVKNVSKKQMIIGYSKSGYDYVAVEYPKGFETDNKLSYFNHNQVYELYSLGYKNEESRIFNGTLVSIQTVDLEEDSDEEKESVVSVEDIPTITSELKFDKNGVVISDGSEIEDTKTIDENSNLIDDTKEEPAQNETELLSSEVVISNEKEELNTTNIEPQTMLSEESSIQNQIRFNEFGVVVSDGSKTEEPSIDTEKEIEPLEESVNIDNNVSLEDSAIEMEEKTMEVLPSIDDEKTIDVSSIVNEMEQENSDNNDSEDPSEPPKKEKKGLFHFGRK